MGKTVQSRSSWEKESKWCEPYRDRAYCLAWVSRLLCREGEPQSQALLRQGLEFAMGRTFRPECWEEESWTKNREWPGEEEAAERRLQWFPQLQLETDEHTYVRKLPSAGERPQQGTSRTKLLELKGSRNNMSSHQPDCKIQYLTGRVIRLRIWLWRWANSVLHWCVPISSNQTQKN